MTNREGNTGNDFLIQQIVLGNEAAFKHLFNRYYALLCAVSYRYVQEEEVNATIAEDALLSLWEKRGQIEHICSLKAYLMTCTRNMSIDYLRSNKKQYFIDLDAATDTCFISDNEIFSAYVASELEERIEEAIETLPEECRHVFRMSRYEEKSYTEIAQELHISVNTVKYHIKNALFILRESLKEFIACLLVMYFF